jgi:oligoendopeptidase F
MSVSSVAAMIPAKQNEITSREQIPEQDCWNLADLFDSVQDWQRDKKRLEQEIAFLQTFKGKLGQSAGSLYQALDYYFNLDKKLMRLYAYAGMLSDQDTRQSEPLAMKQEMEQLQTKLNSISSFLEAEIVRIPANVISSFLVEDKNLQTYRQYLDDSVRRKPHILNEQEEKLIAEAGLMSGTAQEVFNIFSNAELPYKSIRLENGREIKVDPVNYTLHRASDNRRDRHQVFQAFFGTLKEFERTFGTQLYGDLKKNLFYKNVRQYSSCLEQALDHNNIPVSVYHTLIENANAHLPVLHQYLQLRRQRLGLPELHYYDIYPALVKEIDRDYSYAESRDLLIRSLSVLGKTYQDILLKALQDRWIDVYPNPGKRSGAYMEGLAYDVHPYILLNFKGKFSDVSTLAHELGHAVHSSFSNKNQAYVNSRYPIFLAEVASTVNEALLIDYVLKNTRDTAMKISLLGHYLEEFRGTLFRQTQFAEFELQIHETVERGEALTGEKFSRIYLGILKKYYGHQEKICFIDDLYGIEWAYIPHFYYNFYVFQYSTSFTAAQAIVSKILEGEKDMVNRYLQFLSSGCSEYAIPTLQKLGIDMVSPAPFTMAIQRMREIIEQIEKLAADLKNLPEG